ncbi:MAG: 6-phosphogluconolactonase [Pseudomonadota bacterium]
MVEVIAYDSRGALARGLAGLVAGDLRAALAAEGTASLAVPGGTTPQPFLEELATARLDWSSVTVIATDERWVPPDDPRSNEALIREALIDATGAAFLPFWRGDAMPEAAAGALGAALRPAAPLSSAVLGMGLDMHCASLFPGMDGLEGAMDEQGEAMLQALPSPIVTDGAVEMRLTLTARMLSGAAHLRLLITGADKRAALEAALAEDDPLRAPVGAILRRARAAEVHWAA